MNWDSPGRKIRKKVVINGVTYDDSKIIEIQVIESLIDGGTLTLGSVVATQVNLQMRTTNIIAKNAKIEPYICLEDNGVFGTWIKLATVYIDDRTAENNVLSFTCFDKLYLAQKQYNMYSSLVGMDKNFFLRDTSLRLIAQDVANIIGVDLEGSFTLNNFNYIDKVPSYTATTRDVLGALAGVHGACARINRNGQLTFEDFSNFTIKKIYNKADYASCIQTNDERIVTYAEVYTNKQDNYTIGTVTNPENSIDLRSDFMQSALDSIVRSKLANNYTYTPLNLQSRGDPLLTVGDRIRVHMRDGRTVDSIILTNTLNIRVGLTQIIESPSTVNTSEFGRFSVYEEILKLEQEIEQIQEDLELLDPENIAAIEEDIVDIYDVLEDDYNLTERDLLFRFIVTGNAVEGVDYTISELNQNVFDALPWGSIIQVTSLDNRSMFKGGKQLYIDGQPKQSALFVIRKDTQISISVDVAPQIWIETADPVDQGRDGDIWLKVGDN